MNEGWKKKSQIINLINKNLYNLLLKGGYNNH